MEPTMHNVSSDSLFHFTNSYENLKGILRDDFNPNFSLEKYTFSKKIFYSAYPMICFCDLPLSQIKKHSKTYGCYGLGMSKQWAVKNGLNPVFYFTAKSKVISNIDFISENYINLLEVALHFTCYNSSPPSSYSENLQIQFQNFRKKVINEKHIQKLYSSYEFIVKNMKPFKGEFERHSKKIKNYKFYDEREWRYLPETSKISRDFISKEEFGNNEIRQIQNDKIKKAKLKFLPKDINYIILAKEKERYRMLDDIKEAKAKYNQKDISLLSSKIISCERFFKDI